MQQRSEPKVRAISEMIDNRQFKQALKLSESYLKDRVNPLVTAFKAYSQCRLRMLSEAKQTAQEIPKLPNALTIPAVLHLLPIIYRELSMGKPVFWFIPHPFEMMFSLYREIAMLLLLLIERCDNR